MATEPWKKKVDIFLSRFVARQEIFSVRTPYKKSVTDKVTGAQTIEEVATVMPACVNYGDQKLCLITQRKGGCSECGHRVFKSVTPEQIWKHISGQEEMILFMLREEGIRFGAADFDKGNTFEDAKAVQALSMSYGIDCHIAKSTKKGYHVYWFFTDFVQPHEFTSYIRHIYEELGFYQRWAANPEIGIPEVFPKQVMFSDSKIGNGIKVPMMEPRMREGRNCWVDENASPIPFDKQWDFFEQTKQVTPEAFRTVLTEKHVEILQAPASRSRQQARKEAGKEEGAATPPKQFGDFWSVVEGCPSLQEYWAKDTSGTYTWDTSNPNGLFHSARVASMMIGMSTTNGIEVLKQRWPSDKTDYHINHALTTGYTPVTCRWMQDNGVCRVNKHPKCGTHCMKKLPPVIYENGQRVENPDKLPEDQWPEPSPIRYATDRNLTAEDIIERLGVIFKALKDKSVKPEPGQVVPPVYLPADPQARIEGLITKALTMEGRDWDKVKSAIESNKWMKVKELTSLVRRIRKESDEQNLQKRVTMTKSFVVGPNTYLIENGGYVRTWIDMKGNRIPDILSNFTVLFHKESVVLRVGDLMDLSNISDVEDRYFSGTILVDGAAFPFTDKPFIEWQTPDSFFRTITQIAGSVLQYERKNFDHIYNCIKHFSQEQIVVEKIARQIGHHTLKNRSVYLMPSVIIDKEGVRKNEEFAIEKFKPDASRCLDFKVLSEEEFKDLARHIIKDLFECNNSVLTMTTFAHAMAAAILPQIGTATGYNKSPVLWLSGSQSGGKSFVAEAAQNFYGNFDSVQNAVGSANSKLSTGNDFRHAFMLIDDYKKALTDPFGKEFPKLVQAAYDRSTRTAMQRDGKQREKADRMRGLVAITAEDVIENEASALSRSILVDVPFKENRDAGGRVKRRKTEYCGFTPYFIQFILSISDDEMADMWKEYYDKFYEPVAEIHKKVSPGRVCENLTLNMVAFRLAMEMLVARGVIPEVQRDELCRIHDMNLQTIRATIFEAVGNAGGGHVFLEALRELVQNPTRCYILGWPGHSEDFVSTGNSVQLGFYRESTPDVIYIYPKIAHGIVTDMVKKNNNHTQSIPHVARGLYDEGHLKSEKLDRSKGVYAVQMRGPQKSNVRVWPVTLEALGLELGLKERNRKPKKKDGDDEPELAVI